MRCFKWGPSFVLGLLFFLRSAVVCAADDCPPVVHQQIKTWNQISALAPGDPNDVNVHGDECRAVLGPAPEFSCNGPDSHLVPVKRNGRLLSYKNGKFYETGDVTVNGKTETRTEEMWYHEPPDCDRPSMIRGFECAVNSRLIRKDVGNVAWVINCHNHDPHELTDPNFEVVTVVGTNLKTGETCFFDHENKAKPELGKQEAIHLETWDMSKLILPGSEDPAGRADAAARFRSPSDTRRCVRCHDIAPMIIDAYTNQKSTGGDGTMDVLPKRTKRRDQPEGWGYRVIGRMHNKVWSRPNSIVPLVDGQPDNSCVHCHQMTDTASSEIFARKAALAHSPWMPLSAIGKPLDPKREAIVKHLEEAAVDPQKRILGDPILAECPEPRDLASDALNLSESEGQASVLSWSYKNDLGDVPLRDDIRFRVEAKGSDGSSCEIRDVAPTKVGSDQWRFKFPVKSNVNYQYTVRPYRYCFDRTDFKFAPTSAIIPAKK